MAIVRTRFYNALENEIKKNPEMKKTFNQLSFSPLTRIFDEMPCWLDDEVLKDYLYQYKVTFLNMKVEKELVEQYEKNIIKNACEDLLDEQGQIKQAIMDLFGCQKILSDRNIYGLIYAYVSGINQEIYNQSSVLLNNNIQSTGEFYEYFSANNSIWIADEVRKLNKGFSPEKIKLLEEDNFCDRLLAGKMKKRDVIATSVGVGSIVMSSLAVAAILFFKANAANNDKNNIDHTQKFNNRH